MRIYLEKIIFYILFIILLFGLFYGLFLFIGFFFNDWNIKFQVFYFLTCSIILTILFKKIITFYQNIIDRILYPEQKNLEKEIDELCNKIINSVKYKEIFELFLNGFSKIINNNRVLIHYHHQYYNIYTIENDEVSSQTLMTLFDNHNDLFLKMVESNKGFKQFDISNDFKGESKVKETLLSYNYKNLIMFGDRNEMLGWIAYGQPQREKVDPKHFNSAIIKLVDELSQAIEHATLYQQAKRESVEKGILIEVGKKISQSKDLNEILNHIIDSLAEIVQYDTAGIFLIDREQPRNLTYSVLRGYSEESFEKISLQVGKGIVGWSAQYGKGEIVPDVSKDKRYINVRKETKSQMVIPIKSGDVVIGVFCLESDKLNFFNWNHYEVVKTFASQAAIVIENARLYFEIQKKEEMEEEIKRARDIQRALFPEKVPKIPNYEISTFKQYSMELGGDLYDLRRIDDKRLSIAIGDASGKGISGAILVSTLYAAFRTGRKKYLEVNEIIERLNNSVANLTKPGSYYTFFYGILDYHKGIITYTNAGHNPPYLIRNSGKFEQLDVGGIVLGFFKGIKYKMSEIKIETGDILVFYTDGITECKDDKDEEFGEKRFLDILLKNNSLSPKKLQEEIINSLILFTKKSVFSDDITLVIIKKISKENNYE